MKHYTVLYISSPYSTISSKSDNRYNILPQARRKMLILSLWALTMLGMISGDKIVMDCGGPTDGRSKIVGCFGSKDNARYITMDNEFPEYAEFGAKVINVNSSRCLLEMKVEPGGTNQGLFECGSIVCRVGNRSEYMLFGRFNITKFNTNVTAAGRDNLTVKGFFKEN